MDANENSMDSAVELENSSGVPSATPYRREPSWIPALDWCDADW